MADVFKRIPAYSPFKSLSETEGTRDIQEWMNIITTALESTHGLPTNLICLKYCNIDTVTKNDLGICRLIFRMYTSENGTTELIDYEEFDRVFNTRTILTKKDFEKKLYDWLKSNADIVIFNVGVDDIKKKNKDYRIAHMFQTQIKLKFKLRTRIVRHAQ